MERKLKNIVRDELVRFFKKNYNMDLSPAKIHYITDNEFVHCRFKFKSGSIFKVNNIIVENNQVSFEDGKTLVY